MGGRDGFEVISGTAPLILVAPHGGRRDAATRAWGSQPLKVNDLHTAELTRELCATHHASGLINAHHDRNDIDLNRVSAIEERAPEFLIQLQARLQDAIAHHGRVTLLTIHGWNVIQPALDIGLGCSPGANPFVVGAGAAVSPAFAAGAVRCLVDRCAEAGIAASVGERYPARGRENLLQLFTLRYRDDARALIHSLAALAPWVDAVQLELGIPLRWAGGWRDRFVTALASALPALLGPPAVEPQMPPGERARAETAPTRHWLQFSSNELSGLVAMDEHGARLLLFPRDGTLFLFTGERLRSSPPTSVPPLVMESTPDGLAVRLRGPLLHFPDTTPFLDLEVGLARATLADAVLDLTFSPHHAHEGTGDFGRVAGTVRVAEQTWLLDGHGFAEHTPRRGAIRRLRTALRLGEDAHLLLGLGFDGEATGFLCRRDQHVPIATAAVLRETLAQLELEVQLTSGERIRVDACAQHELAVVRAHDAHIVRIVFAALRLAGSTTAAGWCETILP